MVWNEGAVAVYWCVLGPACGQPSRASKQELLPSPCSLACTCFSCHLRRLEVHCGSHVMRPPMSCEERVLSNAVPVPSKETQAEQGLSCVLRLWCVGPCCCEAWPPQRRRACAGAVCGVPGCGGVCVLCGTVCPDSFPEHPPARKVNPTTRKRLIPKVCLACKMPAF